MLPLNLANRVEPTTHLKCIPLPIWRITINNYTIMSGYDCRNKCVFSFRLNVSKDVADVTSSRRLFKILGPAVTNKRSPTVAQRDGLTSRRLVVHRRPETTCRRHISNMAELFRKITRCCAVESSVNDDRHAV